MGGGSAYARRLPFDRYLRDARAAFDPDGMAEILVALLAGGVRNIGSNFARSISRRKVLDERAAQKYI